MKDSDIAWFEPDFTVMLPKSDIMANHSGQIVPWSVTAVGGEHSWAASGDGTGYVQNVDVYVLDTGVAQGRDNNKDDLVTGEHIDFRDLGNQNARDYDGHGTHIAGVIGAYDNTHGVAGIAPGVKIHNYKVLNDEGGTDVSVTIAALEHIIAKKRANRHKAMVVNMSLGEDLGSTSTTALDAVVAQAIEEGITIVIAAGNHGGPVEHVTPARVPGAITVGSYGVEKKFSSFSAYGPLVDILAPGEDIISLSPSETGSDAGKPVSMTGTSMAAGHVTGAAALYLSRNPGSTPGQVLQALLSGSRSNINGTPNGTTNRSLWVGLDTDEIEVVSGQWYGLQNKYSNKCLDVHGVYKHDGANIYQWNCHWRGNQTWQINEIGGFYKIKAQHSGKVIDASRENGDAYNNVIQWASHGGHNQEWSFIESDNGYVTIKARADGGCLEIQDFANYNGNNIRVAACDGGDNQKWKLIPKG